MKNNNVAPGSGFYEQILPIYNRRNIADMIHRHIGQYIILVNSGASVELHCKLQATAQRWNDGTLKQNSTNHASCNLKHMLRLRERVFLVVKTRKKCVLLVAETSLVVKRVFLVLSARQISWNLLTVRYISLDHLTWNDLALYYLWGRAYL